MNRKTWLALGLSFVWSALATADVVYVRVDGDDANSGASWPLAKKTIQAAVDVAPDGSTVWGRHLQCWRNLCKQHRLA